MNAIKAHFCRVCRQEFWLSPGQRRTRAKRCPPCIASATAAAKLRTRERWTDRHSPSAERQVGYGLMVFLSEAWGIQSQTPRDLIALRVIREATFPVHAEED